MKIIKTIEFAQGAYSCDVDITVSEWKELLANDSVTTKNYKKALLAFYDQPEHKATCGQLGAKYFADSTGSHKFSLWITQFGVAVTKKLNRFIIHQSDNDNPSFWNVAMNPGVTLASGEFEWTLRPELVLAIEELGWNKRFTWAPFFMELADKLLQYKDNRAQLLDVIYSLDEKFIGYTKDSANGACLTDIDPFSIIAIFNRGLTDDNRNIIAGVFKNKFNIAAAIPSDYDGVPILNSQKSVLFYREKVETDVQPLWDFFVAALQGNHDDLVRSFDIVRKQQGIKWNLTMALFWIRPFDFIALDSRNQVYLPKLGIDVFDDSKLDAEHYFNLLDEVKSKLGSHKIAETSIPEISYNAWLNNSGRKIWLVGYTFNGSESQFDRFIKENVWEGIFMNASASDKNLLKQAQSIKRGDVIVLKSSSTKGTKHDKPFLRIKAVGVVCDDIECRKSPDYTSCICNVKYLSTKQIDFDGSSFGAFRKTLHSIDNKPQEIIDYVNSIVDDKSMKPNNSKYKEYIELLKANKNVVLTGAPGTGKTYMAKAIAAEMNAVTKFVQFHPSYDYTDFVEGLRPVENGNGQIGFERKNGVFKEFCCEAIRNLEDSAKTIETLDKELSWQERLEQFVEDAIDNNTTYNISNGSEFTIVSMNDHTILVKNEHNEKTSEIFVRTDEILKLLNTEIKLNNVRDIKKAFGRRYGTQPDSYAFAIVKTLREQPKKEQASTVVAKVERKNFVLIIDEINRGEASKIFGELFYAIDPGYRGDNSMCVQTQYQNLVPETDVFAKGFYVPENVYILATMNDIDRSVESMDFAMRRRFTWQEVLPSDTDYMLDSLDSKLATEAKQRMNNLNQAIAATDGLGAAYMIGPAYFLKLSDYNGDFDRLWKLNIEPLLREYLRGFRRTSDIMKKFVAAYSNGNTQAQEENVAEAYEN
jgi:hypothetical protein